MKKIIYSIASLLSFESQGMIVPINNSQYIVEKKSNDSCEKKSQENEGKRVCETIISTICHSEIENNQVLIYVRDFSDNNGEKAFIKEYIKTYPLEKAFLRYKHNLEAGYSRPIWEMYAIINDMKNANVSGKVVVDEQFDGETRLRHQLIPTGAYEMDDDNLQAKPLTKIIIKDGEKEVEVEGAKSRSNTKYVAYTAEAAPVTTLGEPEARPDDNTYNYQRTSTSQKYRRPNGSIFVKVTEGVQKIAKPRLAPPVEQTTRTITLTLPIKHWNKSTWLRSGFYDYNGYKTITITIKIGNPIPKYYVTNSDHTFREYQY